MHRFFVSPETLRIKDVQLSGDIAHQISRVLRMKSGDEVILFDGGGYEYRVRLIEVGREMITGSVLSKSSGVAEPLHSVDLYLSLLNKPDKYEWALQKCTELGVTNFVPILSERSVPGPPEKGRRERWERIIREAAEQSGRTVIPGLTSKLDLNEALNAEGRRMEEDSNHIALMPAPNADLSLRDAILEAQDLKSVSLFIGPEGGFSEDELWEANERGVLLVNMGPRVLRAETAAVAALTIVLYELGEMGGRRMDDSESSLL